MTAAQKELLSQAEQILLIVLMGLLLTVLLQLMLRRMEHHAENAGKNQEQKARLKTLFQASRSLGHLLVFKVVLLMILHELGINIAPILASAGVVGLAFSLGSQTVIKDFLGGVLVLVENQYQVGDVLTINNLTGTVERITLRATFLRDIEGKLILIPNGELRIVSNLTSHWSQAFVTLNVDYEADMGRVLHALETAAQAVQANPDTRKAVIGQPKTIGWAGFSDWAVQVQLMARTKPGAQWVVEQALRKAAVEALHNEGIRVAVPLQRMESASSAQTENEEK